MFSPNWCCTHFDYADNFSTISILGKLARLVREISVRKDKLNSVFLYSPICFWDEIMTTSLTNTQTLNRFILTNVKDHELRSDFAILFTQIQLATKVTANAVRRAPLEHLLGEAGMQNVQGEEVKKLDILSNQAFRSALVQSGMIAAMASEEDADPIIVEEKYSGKYVISFDPLDGSSNIDANVSIGSIFGISRKLSGGPLGTLEDLLQTGRNQIAAGYCLYGSATMIVLSLGTGVYGFTLDNSLGEFILTHPNIKIKPKGNIYSINEGNSKFWDQPTITYVNRIKSGENGKSPYSLRYIGSMVADVHRTLLYGGIFMYPGDSRAPNGKLRLLYEVGPLSYLMEQAGGLAVIGSTAALDVVPTSMHMRTPCFMGSLYDVKELQKEYIQYEEQLSRL